MMEDFDDIPVALREGDGNSGDRQPSRTSKGSSRWRWVIVGGSLAGAVGLSMGVAAAFFNANMLSSGSGEAASDIGAAIAAMGKGPLNGDRSNQDTILTPAQGGAEAQKASASGAAGESVTATMAPGGSASVQSSDASSQAGASISTKTPAKTILGHYPFEEANPDNLSNIGGGILLNQKTANAFRDMQAAARAEGVDLVALSGFRSVMVQQDLFFGVKAQRGQTASERAKVSAPPGHSEHHTGYAVDIGDARNGSTDLSERFETTAAFAWLKDNAPYYSFELSFPRGNDQGVNYEPWHWRYVGDQASLELFHRDR